MFHFSRVRGSRYTISPSFPSPLLSHSTLSFSSISCDLFTRFARFASAENNKTFFQDAVSHNREVNMAALELRDGVGPFQWPSFAERVPHILFHRFDRYDVIRYEHTLNCLKATQTHSYPPTPAYVGWLGTSGIGKSSGVNYILYEMVANIGSPGYPSVVYYRLPTEAVIFSKLNDDQEIQVELAYLPLQKLTSFINTQDRRFHGTIFSKGKSCLILEMGEDEIDPKVSIPALVTVSAKMADVTLKTLIKNALRPYLVAPPTREQILFMEWTRYLHGARLWYLDDPRFVDDDTRNQLLKPSDAKKELLGGIVKQMLDIVGPIPRAFSNADKCQFRLSALQNSSTLVDAINSAPEMKDFNIPQSVKYFIAPYPLEKSEVDPPMTMFNAPVCDAGLYSWQFLSPTTESLYINAILTKQHSEKLKDSGLNFQVAESRVKRYLQKEFQDSWEWLQDIDWIS